MNVAVIGLGKMGILHSGILNALPDVQVKAICESDGFVVRAAKSILPKTIALYDNHTQMVENEQLDAVFVTTPIDSHVPLVEDLSSADVNLSLFVEKPLGASEEQSRAACQAVAKLRGVHMVGFQKRFSPIYQKAHEFIHSGILGDLFFFRAHSFSSDVLREGRSWRFRKETGGVLLDLAPHLLDLLSWFFGAPIPVAAVKRRVYSNEVDDYVHTVMSFESGLKGSADLCWSMRNLRLPETAIEVHGRNGMLSVTDDFLSVQLEKKGKVGLRTAQVWYKQSFNTSVPFLLADSEYTREDEAFLKSVRTRALPEINFFEAAKVNTLIGGINKLAER